MESRNKSDDRSRQTLYYEESEDFLFYNRTKMSNKKKMKKKGTMWKSMNY